MTEENDALKFDFGKEPMGLLPWSALRGVARVLDYGCKKYAAHNWRKGMHWSRLYDAALRHLTAWIEGETCDRESGLSHLSHCLCCLLFLYTYELERLGIDDRYSKPDYEDNECSLK